MMNRRSFLTTSAVGLPAFGAVTLLPQSAEAAMDQIFTHLLAETKLARGHMKSGVLGREVRGLRTMATNTRLLRAHGKALNLRGQLITLHRQFNQMTTTQQRTLITAGRARITTLMQQHGIVVQPIVDPLLFTQKHPGAIIDFDKVMVLASRAFDTAATRRENPIKSAAFRRQEEVVINLCISNVDSEGCPEVHQEEICDTYQLLRLVIQLSVFMFVGMCGTCEGMVLLFQLDAWAMDAMAYWSGC